MASMGEPVPTSRVAVSTSVIVPTLADCQPRYMTRRSPERYTLGGRVADIATALGKPPLPYQRKVYDVALELDPVTGLLAYSTVIIVIPRQNGKSEMLLPVMTHRSLGFDGSLINWIHDLYGFTVPEPGSQRTMYLTQAADEARKKWRRQHLARIEKSPLSSLLLDVTLRQNQEQMLWVNGSTWVPGSATAKTGGTGDTLDLGVIDEGWSHAARTELALRPTMLTRPWAQLWVASMVPGPDRCKPHEWPWLREQIEKGRALVEAGVTSDTCYVEFSAPPGLDPGDPKTWYMAMPALGLTVSERAVRADFKRFNLADFEAEYLGWEPQVGTARWLLVSQSIWRARHDRTSAAGDPVALAIESTSDQGTTSIGFAGLRNEDANQVHIELVERLPGNEWAIDLVVKLCQQWEVCSIAINPSGGAAALIEPLTRALDAADVMVEILKPTSREVSAAAARLVMATGALPSPDDAELPEDEDAKPMRRVTHLGQPELDRSLASATRKQTGELWKFDPAIPGADMSPIRAVALAMWAGDRVEWAGASYDIGSSLG